MIEKTRDAVSLRRQTLGYFVQKHDHGSSYLDRMNDDRRMQVATAVCNEQRTSRIEIGFKTSCTILQSAGLDYCMEIVKLSNNKLQFKRKSKMRDRQVAGTTTDAVITNQYQTDITIS